jgi:4-hydroxybenzoate polyprenyltransferase
MLKLPLADLAELVRAPAALTVPGDVLAGAVAAGNLRPLRLAGLAASSVSIYWAGMALNDWADRRLDAVERPERPIPSGRVPARTALSLASALTAAGLALSAVSGGRAALKTSSVLAATAWTYDFGAKNTPAGPAFMAAARSLDVLVGAGSSRRKAWAPALAVGAHILGVTAMSRGEVHGSTPLSARTALATTTAITTASILTSSPGAGWYHPGTSLAGSRSVGSGAVTAVLAGLFARSVGPAQLAAAREPSGPKLREAVGAGIHGLVPLQAAWCARGGAPRLGAALVVALPLVRALARKVSPT